MRVLAIAIAAASVAFHVWLIFSGLLPNLVSRPLHLLLALPWIFFLDAEGHGEDEDDESNDDKSEDTDTSNDNSSEGEENSDRSGEDSDPPYPSDEDDYDSS